jgi:multidrug resistance efflux pump
MWRGWSVLAITAVAVIALQNARAANTSNNSAETEAVTVTGEATGSLTSVSPEESAKQQKGALLLRWRFLELVNH